MPENILTHCRQLATRERKALDLMVSIVAILNPALLMSYISSSNVQVMRKKRIVALVPDELSYPLPRVQVNRVCLAFTPHIGALTANEVAY